MDDLPLDQLGLQFLARFPDRGEPAGRPDQFAFLHADQIRRHDDELDVLDGGACEVGIESTIIDCTRGQPVLLRPGMLDVAVLEASAGLPVLTPEQARSNLTQSSPKASGTLASHYAPDAKVRLLAPEAMALQAQGMSVEALNRVAVWAPQAPGLVGVHWRAMPQDPALCAQALFQTLRDFEAWGAQEIWVCPPPAGTMWDGVRDRLTRASH